MNNKTKSRTEGKLIIVSAPSGAGKTTIVRHLLNSGLNLAFSISATTREPRGKEVDGKDYFFLPVNEFKKKIENNEFVEWEEVYNDLFYGTMKDELDKIWESGNHVLFDVDVKGGINLKKKYGDRALSIFLMPPSFEELEERLKKRGTDHPDKIDIRIKKSKEEVQLADQFDVVVMNDILDTAKAEILNLVTSFIDK